MNKQEIIVIRNEKGQFLKSFEQKSPALAFTAQFTDEFMLASYIPKKFFDEQGDKYKIQIGHLANMVNGHLETIEVGFGSKTPYEYSEFEEYEPTLEDIIRMLGEL